MVDFKCKRYKDDVPYISDEELDDYAEKVIRDFNRESLIRILPIDHFKFCEYYLGLNVQFGDIYFGKKEAPVLGATCFSDTTLKIFDSENLTSKLINVKRKDVIFDNVLLGNKMKTKFKFTSLHEGAHWLLHQRYFNKSTNKEYCSLVKCTDTSASMLKKQLETPNDFLEHQANYLAAALAMPLPILIKEIQRFLRLRYMIGKLPVGMIKMYIFDLMLSGKLEKHHLISHIAQIFEVSKQASQIRLERLGFC